MHVSVLMHILYASQCLIHQCGDFLVVKLVVAAGAVLHFIQQIAISIFEYYIDFVIFFVVYDLLELY